MYSCYNTVFHSVREKQIFKKESWSPFLCEHWNVKKAVKVSEPQEIWECVLLILMLAINAQYMSMVTKKITLANHNYELVDFSEADFSGNVHLFYSCTFFLFVEETLYWMLGIPGTLLRALYKLFHLINSHNH